MEAEIINALVQGMPTGAAVLVLYVLFDRRLIAVETHIKHLLGKDD